MASSYNGWIASPDPNAISINKGFSVAGVTFPGGVKSGPVETIFRHLITRIHNEVEPLHPGWCWGYDYRSNVNNPSTLSCHASGTAIDYNAPNHPNGTSTPNGGGGWSISQYNAIKGILNTYEGTVRWLTSNDPMHFEISGSVSAVARVASKLGNVTPPPPPPPAGSFPLPDGYYYGPKSGPNESISGMAGENANWIEGLRNAQRRLIAHGFNLSQYGADGKYGEDASGETHDAIVRFQQSRNLEADGLIGLHTWNALQEAPSVVTPPPPPSVPGFPLPGGYYYGPKSGPNESISGMAGEDSSWIEGLKTAQRRLMAHIPGCLNQYGADGKYGNDLSGETHDATVRFQQAVGIGVDGLIGINTWNALWR